jgi:hypothetical protein
MQNGDWSLAKAILQRAVSSIHRSLPAGNRHRFRLGASIYGQLTTIITAQSCHSSVFLSNITPPTQVSQTPIAHPDDRTGEMIWLTLFRVGGRICSYPVLHLWVVINRREEINRLYEGTDYSCVHTPMKYALKSTRCQAPCGLLNHLLPVRVHRDLLREVRVAGFNSQWGVSNKATKVSTATDAHSGRWGFSWNGSHMFSPFISSAIITIPLVKTKAQDVLDTHSLSSSLLLHSSLPEHCVRHYKQGSLVHFSASLAVKYKEAFLKFYNEVQNKYPVLQLWGQSQQLNALNHMIPGACRNQTQTPEVQE